MPGKCFKAFCDQLFLLANCERSRAEVVALALQAGAVIALESALEACADDLSPRARYVIESLALRLDREVPALASALGPTSELALPPASFVG